MKQTYESKTFRADTQALIDQANTIINEYQADGYELTLRQLYYQFVARDLIENSQRSYKRLGKVISNARMAGLIDWEAIVDRTRNLHTNSHWSGVNEILKSAADSFRRDLWEGQEYAVEVWIEKEALIGVIEGPCVELDIPYFACRGYVSQSEQWRAGERVMDRWHTDHQKTIILHLGDHDPSGVDMTRDNQDRIDLFSDYESIVTVRRIALNWEQVQEYNPPPNPTKLTDTRAGDYIKRYGMNSWELDALEPRLIDRLIRGVVDEYIDHEIMSAVKARQESERRQLQTLAKESVRAAKD